MGCELCPRQCGAKRCADTSDANVGFCGETEQIRLARAALHMWEEPCISGEEGSGAIFFTGCVLRCVFCQNHSIANGSVGKTVTVERLAEIMLELQAQKANNINLVTPTHFVPQIVKAIQLAKQNGLRIPIVYNTGGYERVETLRLLDGLVDVYLPDMKYASADLAAKYSLAKDYPQVAQVALAEMVRQAGVPQFDARGMMTKGVIVRHLMLPGQLQDSKEVIRNLYESYHNDIYISMMNQYTPMQGIGEKYPELNRKVRKASYEKLIAYALSLGVEQAYVQEGETAKESFIPAFNYEGV